MAKVTDWEMGFDVRVSGKESTILYMQQLLPETRKALEEIIGKAALDTRDRARQLASGDVLHEKTGSYVNSIKSELISDKEGVFGEVYSNDPRAGLFEYGGSTPARDILPNVKQVMAFAGGGSIQGILTSLGLVGTVFAKVVHRPVVEYPKHSVIDAAFDEARNPVGTKIGEAVIALTRSLDQKIDAASRSHTYDAE